MGGQTQSLTVLPYAELQPWLQEPQAWIPALPRAHRKPLPPLSPLPIKYVFSLN